MFINTGQSDGSGGGGEIIIQGSQHYNVNTLSDLNNIDSPPANSTAYVIELKTSYTYYNSNWIVISRLYDEIISQLQNDLSDKVDRAEIEELTTPQWGTL